MSILSYQMIELHNHHAFLARKISSFPFADFLLTAMRRCARSDECWMIGATANRMKRKEQAIKEWYLNRREGGIGTTSFGDSGLGA